MTSPEPKEHWDSVYGSKSENEVSWFQQDPATSFEFISRCGAGSDDAVIDIGAGESRLAERLLDAGYRNLTVLDISAEAITHIRKRLVERGKAVEFIVADILEWKPQRKYRVWHDRAVFHFLTSAEDRAAYRQALLAAVSPGGCVVISTFAPDGPERCSGLPVVCYSGDTLRAELGPQLRLVETAAEEHKTPSGSVQRFQYSRFERL